MKGRGQNIPLVTDTKKGCTRKLFSKLNPARVCADHPTPMEQATHTGEGLVQPNFDEVKGGFPSTSGIKKYHIKRKQGGDTVKGRGQNIPLVTNIGSDL